MKCPYCGHENLKVINSRSHNLGSSIKRRRECEGCGNRFNTIEKMFRLPMKVVKKDGSKEDFDRNKIRQGVLRALVKRNFDNNKIEQMLDEIERKMLQLYDGEIQSSELGNIIMESLLEVDEVAYIRFASVYNKFESLDSFIEIIKQLKKKKKAHK